MWTDQRNKAVGTNLGKAERWCVRVVVLGDEDAHHKVAEFVSQAKYRQNHQKEGGHKELPCRMRGKILQNWDAPHSPPPSWNTPHTKIESCNQWIQVKCAHHNEVPEWDLNIDLNAYLMLADHLLILSHDYSRVLVLYVCKYCFMRLLFQVINVGLNVQSHMQSAYSLHWYTK